MNHQNQAVLARENNTRLQEVNHHPEADRRGSEKVSRIHDLKKHPLSRLDEADSPRRFRRIAYELCVAQVLKVAYEKDVVVRARMDILLGEIGKKALALQLKPGGRRLVQEIVQLQMRLRNASLILWGFYLRRTLSRKAGRTTAEIQLS